MRVTTTVDAKPAKRPLNLGHRGAQSLAPENTLAAFAKARDVGADGVEFDVQLSADGELVAIHDHTLERTTDGRGAVAAQTLIELKQLDAGRWFDARYCGERIPTLQEVIDLLGGEMFLNIELKGWASTPSTTPASSPERVAGTSSASARDPSTSSGLSLRARQAQLPERVVDCVRRNRCERRVLLSSFHLEALRRVRQIAPSLAIGVLYVHPISADRLAGLHAEALHPEWKLASAELVRIAHSAGQKVNVWTVNAEADMRNLMALGVDAIITNYPQLLAAILKEAQG